MRPQRPPARPSFGRPPRPDPAAERARQAESIAKSTGVPIEVARQIAAGRLDLNEALKRMAFADEVQALMKRHSLDRALATQVAMGHANLEQVLARRRLEAHVAENRDRTALVEGREVTLGIHGHKHLRGRIAAVTPYEVAVHDVEAGTDTTIHKTQIKYAFAPDDFKRVRKAMEYDKARRESTVEPVLRPQERYACSNKRLGGAMARKAEITAVTVEGECFAGEVVWIARFEFGLRTRQGAEVTIFRHALADFRDPQGE